jgi:hypothetical protein
MMRFGKTAKALVFFNFELLPISPQTPLKNSKMRSILWDLQTNRTAFCTLCHIILLFLFRT